MARFRRRKAPVVWLPSTVTNVTAATSGNSSFYVDSVVVDALNYERRTNIYTLTVDYPASAIRAAAQIPSLGDYEASGYRIIRIVGKFTAAMSNAQPAQGSTSPIAALLGLALMVVRVDEASGAPLRAADAYSPTRLDNIQDPFLFRRTWTLQNDFAGFPQATQDSWQFPRGNAEYGSVMDGPHIDARVRRRVGDEERIMAIVSATNIAGDATLAGEIRYTFDWRILATPIRAAGNRRNASR